MLNRSVLLIASSLLLAGCETSNTTYEHMYGDKPLEYSQAECRMYMGSVDQGVVAWGSTSYVIGAQLGNALGNAIREQQFYDNCMVMHGWKKVPVGQNSTSVATKPQTSTFRSKNISGLLNQWASWNNQCFAGSKPACQARDSIGAKLESMGVHPGA